MGFPISPALPNLVLERIEQKSLAQIPNDVNLFFGYVDVFTCVPDHKVDDIVTRFKNYHPQLNFTVQIEK